MKPALIATVALALTVYLAPPCAAEQRPTKIAQPTQGQNPSPVAPTVGTEGATTNTYGYEKQAPIGDVTPEWVLVIVGIITAGFIGWQSLETRKAAVAAKLNADYLRESAAAYLTLADSKENVTIGVGVNPTLKFFVVNKGTTPAVNCRIRYCTEIIVEPYESSWDFTSRAYRAELGETSTIDPAGGDHIGGRSIIPIDVGHPLSAEEDNSLRTGSRVLAVWLNMEFTDVFKRRRYRNFGIYVGRGGVLCLLPKYNDSGEVPAEHKSKKPN
jgi:hypothetical protein